MRQIYDVLVRDHRYRDSYQAVVRHLRRRYGTPKLDHVVIRAEGTEIARHARGTPQRLLIDPRHYDGPSTDRVERPTPLGRRGQLQMAGRSSPSRQALLNVPECERVARPLDAYVQLVEALR